MSLKPNCTLVYFTGFLVLLLSDTMFGRTVVASHHKPQIAFASNRDGNGEIYVMDADGNNQIRLTHHPAGDSSPSWSPNGHRIAFVSNRNGGNYQIYVMDSNGKNVRRLTEGVYDGYPAWSPDGQTIAFEGFGDEEWSFKIYVISPDGTNLQRLAADIPSDDRHPTWSPDSQQIAFVSWREDWNAEIYMMDADGGNQRRLTNNTVAERGPSWSPDGNKIAFWSSLDGDNIIVVMDADGTNRNNLTEKVRDGLTVWDSDPAWAPDGRMIAYRSHIFGHNKGEIHLMTADGEHIKRLGVLHKKGDYHPDWFAPAGLAVSPVSNQITIWAQIKNSMSHLR